MYWKRINAFVRTSSFRFALMTMGIIWLVTTLVLVAMYGLLRQSVWQNIDSRMNQYASVVTNAISAQPDLVASEILEQFQDMPSFHISMNTDTDSSRMNDSYSLMAEHHSGLSRPPDHLLHAQQMMRNMGNQQVMTRDIPLPDGSSVQLALNVDYLDDLNHDLFKTLMRGILFTLILAIVGSIILTRRSLKRTNQINEACTVIMAGNLDHRLPVPTPNNSATRLDDHDQMAANINAMLDRIQALMNNVQQVSDNIAHDLKSPLARLRTHLEKIQYDQPSDAIQDALNEADRMMILFKSLLGIARLESMTLTHTKQVDMSKLLADLTELYEPVFEDAGITFVYAIEPGAIRGDADLLFQAMTNLLDNAVKFTPTGGNIRLVSQQMANGYHIVLSDSGPGIPDKDIDHVMERFYRVDSARSTQGFGLGLSLVKAIIGHHQGTISLNNRNGLSVALFFPI